ncbi:MAG: tetratricopeptide repeat protein [Acidobacteriaceae bacterium]|nr:tetratricopeptide repeat protein [Acidobacteriaceae bacterium]
MVRVSAICCAIALVLLAAIPVFGRAGSENEQLAAHKRLAQQYLNDNKPDLAVQEFRAIVALSPNDVEARGNLGVLLFFQGNYKDAAQELRAALHQQPALWKLEALLGMSERRIGQTAQAQTDLEKAFPQLREEKIRVQTGMELIEMYYGAGALDKAAAVVTTLRQLRPTDIDVLYTAHRIYSDLADESMLSVAMLAPDSARMHQLMAHEAARRGNTDEAIAQFRQAMKIDANIPGLRFELAEALSGSMDRPDREEAERDYRTALKKDPFDERAECRLGIIAARNSDLQAAAAHYSRALELQPNDADAAVGLAKALIGMKQPEKAMPLLERAAQLDPFNAVVHYHLSVLYRNAGRENDAQRERDEFLKVRAMKARLAQVYQAMRLQPVQGSADQDVPN